MASARRKRAIRSGLSEQARTRIRASGTRVSTLATTRLTPETAVDQGGSAGVVQRIDREHRGVGSGIALHADRMHGDDDAIRRDLERRARFRAETADCQAGAGERMAVQQFSGEPIRARSRAPHPCKRTSAVPGCGPTG